MPDCIFCSIASGDIPADIVVDNGTTLAFRDIDPKADVHILVIPRQHVPTIGELAAAAPEVAASLITTASRLAVELGVADGGYRLIANTGPGAGQTVFHAHLHLLAGRDLPGF